MPRINKEEKKNYGEFVEGIRAKHAARRKANKIKILWRIALALGAMLCIAVISYDYYTYKTNPEIRKQFEEEIKTY